MSDWASISQFATAAGTLVLAGATFAAVRSANTAARTAERSLMAGLRPLLIPSRTVDPVMKVLWSDSHFIALEGGRAYAHLSDDGVINTQSSGVIHERVLFQDRRIFVLFVITESADTPHPGYDRLLGTFKPL